MSAFHKLDGPLSTQKQTQGDRSSVPETGQAAIEAFLIKAE
jgi:hypothetical protein